VEVLSREWIKFVILMRYTRSRLHILDFENFKFDSHEKLAYQITLFL